MGYASAEQVDAFLKAAPGFEKLLVDDGILLFKYWLAADQAEQEERLRERLEDPLKRWKLSPTDLAAREKYDEYTKAREAMLKATHTPHAPWTLVDFNDQRRGRLTLVRDLLSRIPDTHEEPDPITFPDLARKPASEKYKVLKPIADFPLP
jgi:polyphosphate kinase 2 (PPK2 family)